MTGARMPAKSELDVALWLDGRSAIEVAEVAHGAPGWPPLLQLLAGGGWREAPLVDAQADRERGWPLDGYMYPVPRARVEQALDRVELDLVGVLGTARIARLCGANGIDDGELMAALVGAAEPLRRVAIELATSDRRAVAS